MAGSPRKRERRRRLADLTGDPATMSTIVRRVAEGGTLLELCREWQVAYSDVVVWIGADHTRKERYDLAVECRGEWLGELVIAGIRAIADLDLAEAYDAQGALKPMHQIPEHIRRAIAAVEVAELYEGQGQDRRLAGQTSKLKLVSKEKALELLGKYRKMFVDRIEHQGKVTLEELVGGSMPPQPGEPKP